MKFYRLLIFIFGVIYLTTSCTRTNDRLQQAEQLIETAPDSAMSILNKYNYKVLSDKDKALYGLVYIQVRDKKFLSLEPDSLLNFSTNYYQNTNNEHNRLGACYLYKGRDLKYAFQYEKAMEYYLKALEISTNNLILGRVNFDIGYILCSQKEFEQARKKFRLSYNQFVSAGSKSLAFNPALYIGRTYNINGEFKKALNYYNNLKINISDSIDKGVLFQEIALNCYYLSEYDSALRYLKEVIYYPYVTNNRAIRYYMISDIFYDINKIDSSIQYANKAFSYSPDIRTKKGCYRILTNCYSKKNNLPKVEEFMHKYQKCSDSIQEIDSQTKGSYIETMHNAKREVAKSHSWIWYLFLTLLLLISGSVVLYFQKHKKSKLAIEQSKQSHILQKAKIHKDIMIKKRTTLLANIERLKTEQKQTEKGANNYEKRVKNMYNELLHIQDVPLFFCEMDDALNNIVTKLKVKVPEINEKELIWCCLHLLNVPIQDQLILLDYESVNSLKGMKRRFAQKLHLQNAGLLDDFLLQLLSID